jgi:cyclohexyl-isocyanide hydratase
MTTVGMVLFPRVTQLDVTAPYEVFTRMPDTRAQLVAARPGPLTSDCGLVLTPDSTFSQAPQFDVLFVPGGNGLNDVLDNDELLSFVRQQGEQAKYVTGVCTGSLLLGAAGLLRGYRATIHWLSLDLLRLVGAEPVAERVVIDRNRITGAGVTAGIDLGLTVAGVLHGQAVAEEIQLMMEYNPQPPFQAGSPRTANGAIVRSVTATRAQIQDERRRKLEGLASRLNGG